MVFHKIFFPSIALPELMDDFVGFAGWSSKDVISMDATQIIGQDRKLQNLNNGDCIPF